MRTGGEGVKKSRIFSDVIYGWPLTVSNVVSVVVSSCNSSSTTTPFYSTKESNAIMLIVREKGRKEQ